jgi:pimeloyl-ACP methyl ester carboxylesterase
VALGRTIVAFSVALTLTFSLLLLWTGEAHGDTRALAEAKTRKLPELRTDSNRGFSTFETTVVGLSETNAYWLAWLSAMVYPQNLAPAVKQTESVLQASPAAFQRAFRSHVENLFPEASTFRFFSATSREGFNPEAMVVTTDRAVIVVFRGTDKLITPTDGVLGAIVAELGEWIVTDANVLPLVAPPGGLGGRVHRGMKESLDVVRESLARHVLDQKGKPVWIAGHSLGGGHAQLMAADLKARGADVRGLYLYNSPHPGDVVFSDALDRQLGANRIQRFEYLDDPIAMLPAQISVSRLMGGVTLPSPLGGFGRVGVRNAFRKLEGSDAFLRNQPERLEGQVNRADLSRSGTFSPLAICYHNPHWITAGLHARLPAAVKALVPQPLSLANLPGCGPIAARTGRTGVVVERQLVNDAAEAAGEVLEAISYDVDALLQNATGQAVAPGRYRLRCLRGGGYLEVKASCVNNNGCGLHLARPDADRSRQVFEIVREGPSYRLRAHINGRSLDLDQDAGRLQIWDSNFVGILNANQKWLFYRVGSASGRNYVLLNGATIIGGDRRVVDAINSETTQEGGRVVAGRPRSNDATQVWVLEPAP